MSPRHLRNIFRSLALFLALQPAIAAAQIPNITLPQNTVVGRSQLGTGPAQAISFAQLIALMLQTPSLSIPSISTNSIVFKGSTSGQATVQAPAVAGTPSLILPTGSGTIPSSAVAPITLNAAGEIGCVTCLTTASSPALFVQSRAAAILLNLSAVNVVTTGGYATAGDGGGATFKNVGSAPFLDSQIATGSITAGGSGYVNGNYLGIPLNGGTGTNAYANILVSGGAITAFAIVANNNGYVVGDVLTVNNVFIGGSGSGFNWTVSAITTPTGSFTDSVGTHFQIVTDQGNYLNVRQFGAKCDYTTTKADAGSTNDTTTIQNALNFGGLTVQPTIDGGGVAGQNVLLPFGNCLTGALIVPLGVKFRGQNAWSSQLKFLDSLVSNVIPITLCDPNSHSACFGTQLSDMTLRGGSGAAAINVPMIFSNSLQQTNAVSRVALYPQQRGCIQYDTGWGGAAWFGVEGVECTMSSIGSPGFNFSHIGTVIIKVKDSFAEFGGSGGAGVGIQITGGFVDIDGYHSEGVTAPIVVNIPGSAVNGFVRVHNATGGFTCNQLVQRQSGSAANTVLVGNLAPNGCTNTYNNAGTGSGAVIVGPDTLF
jgi:hypothetical protein